MSAESILTRHSQVQNQINKTEQDRDENASYLYLVLISKRREVKYGIV
jgi:hypothetical protein